MMHIPEHFLELDQIYHATLARQIRSLCITSTNPGEGVSTLVLSLARRHLLAGRSTLLLDLNLHRPSLHLTHQLPRLRATQALLSAPQPISLANTESLCAVVSAPLERNNLLKLRAPGILEGYIKQWLEKFDAVMIDASPISSINGGNLPSERSASACDATLISVLSGSTTETMIKSTVHKLNHANALVLGCVLNDRINPTLKNELLREVNRLSKHFPSIAAWLSHKIRNNPLLSLEV